MTIKTIDLRAEELFLEFAEPGPAAPHTQHVSITGKLAIVGEALPMSNSRLLHKGRIGAELSPDQGAAAARQAIICALGQLRTALNGSLNSVKQVVQLTAFLATADDFKDHDKILEKASELLTELWGPAGRHSRSAVGVTCLPKGAPVMIQLQVLLK